MNMMRFRSVVYPDPVESGFLAGFWIQIRPHSECLMGQRHLILPKLQRHNTEKYLFKSFVAFHISFKNALAD
jgi:hypothetical protein